MKVLMADYEEKYAVIELIGNGTTIGNDIMTLRRDVTDQFSEWHYQVHFTAENVLNFHSGDKDYYK
jgi:hypothetical protein